MCLGFGVVDDAIIVAMILQLLRGYQGYSRGYCKGSEKGLRMGIWGSGVKVWVFFSEKFLDKGGSRVFFQGPNSVHPSKWTCGSRRV